MEEFERLSIKRDQIWAFFILVFFFAIFVLVVEGFLVFRNDYSSLFLFNIIFLILILIILIQLGRMYQRVLVQLGMLKIESIQKIEELKEEIDNG